MLNFNIFLILVFVTIITPNVNNEVLPFMVVIKHPDEIGFACTGTIINSEWILTSAACVHNENSKSVEVQYGVTEFPFNEPEIGKISCIFLHTNYEHNKYFNDIALMRLDRPIEFNQFIQPVNLPSKGLNIPDNQLGFVGAWTQSTISPDQSSGTLKKIDSTILSNEGNRMVFHILRAAVLFAKTCLRDNLIEKGRTGSPLILDEQQIGIYVSEFSNDALNNDTNVYTDVSFYRDWIDDIVNSYENCPI